MRIPPTLSTAWQHPYSNCFASFRGLTLAQSLCSQGIDFDLFERDEGSQARVQGWAVALQWWDNRLQINS